jgi:hypothetical protein
VPLSAASLGSGTTGTDKGKPGATRGRKATGLGDQSAGLPKAGSAGSPAAEVRRNYGGREETMRMLSTVGGSIRHGLGAATEAAVVIAIGIALVFGAAVLTRSDPGGAAAVYAAKGGNGVGNGGSGGGGNSGTAPTSSISLNQTFAGLKLGDPVTFTTSAVGLSGGEYPLVYLECKSVLDGSVLYGQLDHPDATFILGGGSSQWWLDRGAANCNAVLYSYGGKTRGGYDEIRLLAGPAEFGAEGLAGG